MTIEDCATAGLHVFVKPVKVVSPNQAIQFTLKPKWWPHALYDSFAEWSGSINRKADKTVEQIKKLLYQTKPKRRPLRR